MRAQPIDGLICPTLNYWDDNQYFETELEAKLAASLKMQQREPAPTSPEISDRPAPPPTPIRRSESNDTTYAQLVSGCGVALIDAYATIRDYASSKAISLAELKNNGFDLQDLLSTLIIDQQRKAEQQQPRRNWGNR